MNTCTHSEEVHDPPAYTLKKYMNTGTHSEDAKFRNLDLFLTPFQNKRAKCFYGPSITHKNVKNMSCDDGHLN
jgi:hypothetical protein